MGKTSTAVVIDALDINTSSSESISKDDVTCGICLDILNQAVVTKCGHAYDLDEIAKWIVEGSGAHDACPHCRAPLKNTELFADPVLAKKIETFLESNPEYKSEQHEPEDCGIVFKIGQKYPANKFIKEREKNNISCFQILFGNLNRTGQTIVLGLGVVGGALVIYTIASVMNSPDYYNLLSDSYETNYLKYASKMPPVKASNCPNGWGDIIIPSSAIAAVGIGLTMGCASTISNWSNRFNPWRWDRKSQIRNLAFQAGTLITANVYTWAMEAFAEPWLADTLGENHACHTVANNQTLSDGYTTPDSGDQFTPLPLNNQLLITSIGLTLWAGGFLAARLCRNPDARQIQTLPITNDDVESDSEQEEIQLRVM